MKKTLKIFWNVIQGVIILYVIIITCLLFFSNKYGYTELGSYTLNNTSKGDLLFIKKNNSIKKGDNIYYYATSGEKYIIFNDEVIEVKKDKSYVVGNVNINSTIKSDKVIGTKVASYKHIGKFLDLVESRVGFLLLVLLPILIVFVSQVYEFLISMRYKK